MSSLPPQSEFVLDGQHYKMRLQYEDHERFEAATAKLVPGGMTVMEFGQQIPARQVQARVLKIFLQLVLTREDRDHFKGWSNEEWNRFMNKVMVNVGPVLDACGELIARAYGLISETEEEDAVPTTEAGDPLQ